MLTIAIHLIPGLHGLLQKLGHGLTLFAEGFAEAEELRRIAHRKFPYAGE